MKHLYLFVCVFLAVCSFSQAPTIMWERSYGGSDDDYAYSVDQTFDGGFIIAGYTHSSDSDVTANHGGDDYWIVKTDSSGNIMWEKSYGGTDYDRAYSVQQTVDGGYIATGSSYSVNGDISSGHGSSDYWVIKLNPSGVLEWEKSYGGSSSDDARSIKQTSDGGYVITGFSASDDGDVTENKGIYDYWIVKTDSIGSILWEKSYGGSGSDGSFTIQECSDHGFIISGVSSSDDWDVTVNHGSADYWLLKIDSTGNFIWEKSYGGTDNEWGRSVTETTDGGFIVAGYSFSTDGDVVGNHGDSDFWMIKTDNKGEVKWEKCYGGTFEDKAYAVTQTSDLGFIIAGQTSSSDGDVLNNQGYWDFWVVKTDSSGNLQWQKNLGGSSFDEALSIQQTFDNGYIIAGASYSNDGDVSGNHGDRDYWVVRLNPSVNNISVVENTDKYFVYPNPATDRFSVAMDNINTIEIFNNLGSKILTISKNTNIDISMLERGIYFVKITSDSETIIKRMIKQ